MPERHVIESDGQPEETAEWLNDRNHACVIAQPLIVTYEYNHAVGDVGIFIRKRTGGPLLMALIGDVLLYDGVDVTIE